MTPEKWRKAVVDRDKVCVDCGSAGPLHAHHVKPKSTHPELRFDVDNGVTVCPTCHWRRHEADRFRFHRPGKRGPHRATMEKEIAHLKAENETLRQKNDELRAIVITLRGGGWA